MRGRHVSMQWSCVSLDSVGGEDVARASVRKTRTRTVFLWLPSLRRVAGNITNVRGIPDKAAFPGTAPRLWGPSKIKVLRCHAGLTVSCGQCQYMQLYTPSPRTTVLRPLSSSFSPFVCPRSARDLRRCSRHSGRRASPMCLSSSRMCLHPQTG